MSLSRSAACLALAFGAAACSAEPTGETGPARPAGPGAAREAMTPRIDSILAAARLGGEIWRLNLTERCGNEVRLRSMIVDGGLLIGQDQTHRIHAIDVASGIHLWLVDLPGALTQSVGGTPSTATFVSADEIVAVQRRGGARLNGTRDLPRAFNHMQFFPSGRAVSVGSTAYVGRLAPFSLQSLDLTGAQEGWSYATSGTVVDTVVYGDGATAQVITVTEDGFLFALPPRPATESSWSPKENWHRRLAGTRVVTPLTLAGDSLLFGSDHGFLYHVDARTGTVRWKVGCGRDLRGNAATVAGGAVYQHTDGTLKSFDLATGAEQWTLPGAKRAITRVGDRVHAAVGGEVVVVDARSGKELSRFSAAGLVLPTIQGGGMLLASDGTNVFALQ